MTTLKELYEAKGQAITEIEIWQAKLAEVNRQIVETMNATRKPPVTVKEAEKNGSPR